MPVSGTAGGTGDELCEHVLADPSVVRRHLREGATLHLDSPDDGFSVVIDGALALRMVRRDGGSITLEILGPGACIPAVARTGARQRPFVLSALVASSVARVQMATFERVVRAKPFLSTLVGAKMAEQHGELLDRFAAMSERSPFRRLAATILYLTDRVGKPCSLAGGMRVPLPQHVIGEVADLSRQTANRYLRQLQAVGLVRVERGMVCALDTAALVAVADGAPVAPVWRPVGPCQLMHPDEPLTCVPLRRAPQRNTSRA